MDEIQQVGNDTDDPLQTPVKPTDHVGWEEAKIIVARTREDVEEGRHRSKRMALELPEKIPHRSRPWQVDRGAQPEEPLQVDGEAQSENPIQVDPEVDKKSATIIFRLPGWFHKFNEEICEPKMVAIGPYHRGKESLQTMEVHKISVFGDFLARNYNVCPEAYHEAMRSIEQQARQCYSQSVNLENDDFAVMLLLDGSFVLEWFRKLSTRQMDAICDVGWAAEYIFSDMCLMENQLPFFVIHKLFLIQDQGLGEHRNCEGDCPLVNLMLGSLEGHHFISKNRRPQVSCKDIHHWLHLYYTAVVPDVQIQPQTQTQTQKEQPNSKSHKFCGLGCIPLPELCSKSHKADPEKGDDPDETEHINIPCASDLNDAGVEFKRKRNPSNIMDIKFKNGTIEMPFLRIQKTTITLLWNMVAFEQSLKPWNFPMTLSSYLALMDSLINTEKDIAILEQSGVVNNFSPNAEEAAAFFNQFANNFVLNYKDHYFHDLYRDVREYSESTWHKNRARLMHDYFSTPWSIISFVAATILLILTVIQTYYSAAK